MLPPSFVFIEHNLSQIIVACIIDAWNAVDHSSGNAIVRKASLSKISMRKIIVSVDEGV